MQFTQPNITHKGVSHMLSKSLRLCATLFIVASGLTPSFAHLYARKELSTYKEVKNEYLKTFAQEKKETVLYDALVQENNKPERKLVVEKLSDYTQHDLVTSMFIHHGTLQGHHGVIDTTFIRKMELLCGSESLQEHLLGHLVDANSMSVFGQAGFASILINPTTDFEELFHRQTVVATFNDILQDDHLKQKLTASFVAIKETQTETIRYWHTEPDMNKELFKRVYWGTWFKGLNKNTVALEAATRLRNFFTTLGITFPLIITTAQNAQKEYSKQNGKISKTRAAWEGFKQNIENINNMRLSKKTFKDCSFDEIFNKNGLVSWKNLDLKKEEHVELVRYVLHQTQPQTLGDQFHIQDCIMEKAGYSAKPLKIFTLGLYAFSVGIYAYSTKKIIDSAQLNTCITNHIHERLIAVATCIREARNLYEFLRSYEATATMPAVQQLASFFEENSERSSELSNLLAMLQTNTFKGEPSFFTITGRVLAAHTLMNEVKDQLIPLFEAVGHIEAYLAAAKLYTKHKELPAKFCFAEFVQADKPTIVMNSFWNPFIASEVVVPNDAVFNSSGAKRNVILTGPNTAGKSTVIKGVGLNILLAQTFGICAAQHARLTPFSILNCHLNITDDTAAGTSLFHAEVKRAKALLDDIQSLPQENFCFTIMDEVFNGTNAEGGSEAAYKFSDQLGKYSNLILVIATHFGKLTELEETGNFRNLHVGAYLDETGALIRPFKLQTGIFKDPENKVLHAILEREGIFTTELTAPAA